MDKNRIAEGIKGIRPLLLDGFHLIEQAYVFDHGAEEVGDVYKVGDFLFVESLSPWRPNFQNAYRAFLAAKRHGDQLGDPSFSHAAANFRILFIFKKGDAVALQRNVRSRESGKRILL